MVNGKLISEFLYRILGSILMTFVREFGSENIRRMVQFIGEHEPFWESASRVEQMEEDMGISVQPWKRGAHDFLD